MDIVKYQRPRSAQESHEAYVRAMYLLFLLQNANPKPDADGSFYLGTIENPAPKTWSKATPYSVSQPKESQ